MKRFLRRLTSRSRFEREMTDELRDHLERRADDLVRAGLSRGEAHRRARIEFGAVESYKEEIRDGRRWAFLVQLPGKLGRDLRFAVRRLRGTPMFSIFAIVSLALGVGVTTAFYSVVYPLLWPTTGVRDAHALAYLMVRQTSGTHASDWIFTTARGDLEDLRRSQTSFSSLAAWVGFGLPFIDGNVATAMRGEAVTGNYFETLGARVALGRGVVAADDAPGAPRVVVLDHAFWKTSLGGDPAVLGRMVRIGGQPVQVVGIADPAFHGVQQPYLSGGPQMWMPLTVVAELARSFGPAVDPSDHRSKWLSVIGRLRPGRSVEPASAELEAIGRELDRAFPLKPRYREEPVGPDGSSPRRWSAARADEAVAAVFRANVQGLFVVLALVALVLAVACTNLANLMLARGSARQHEFAVRRALGSSRAGLVREQLAESVVLAVVGGATGVLIARVVLLTIAANSPVGTGFTVETDLVPGVLIASGAAILLSLIVFGVWPALHLSRTDVRSALATASGTAGAMRWRTRRSLIAAQVAVSAAFFLVAAMCVRSMVGSARIETGIDLDRLAIAQVNFSLQQWDEGRARAAIDRMLREAHAEPAVDAVAVSAGLPFGVAAEQVPVSAAAPSDVPDPAKTWTYLVSASPDIFRTLGVPIVRGRAFDDRDGAGTSPVVVLSERTATSLLGSRDVIGRQVWLQLNASTRSANGDANATPSTAATVVGVARDTEAGSIGQQEGHHNVAYVPIGQHYNPAVVLVARTAGDPAAMAGSLRGIIRRADPDLAVGLNGTASTLLGGIGVTIRMLAVVASALGALVLSLAMTGLFGVLSHLVARRTREMGVRIALGATARDIISLVLVDGVRPVVVGLLVGTALGSAGRLVFRSMVRSQLDAVDPLALVLTPLPLMIAAVVACYWPARRASRVDPNVALRDL